MELDISDRTYRQNKARNTRQTMAKQTTTDKQSQNLSKLCQTKDRKCRQIIKNAREYKILNTTENGRDRRTERERDEWH